MASRRFEQLRRSVVSIYPVGLFVRRPLLFQFVEQNSATLRCATKTTKTTKTRDNSG
jgi:hypothetical protein